MSRLSNSTTLEDRTQCWVSSSGDAVATEFDVSGRPRWRPALRENVGQVSLPSRLVSDLVGNRSLEEPTRRQRLELEFTRLRNEWLRERGPLSSVHALAMLPPYQRIIGLGSPVVPLLLRELATSGDHWFWALKAITGEDPVPHQDRGDVEAMTQAWLRWGRERDIFFPNEG